MYFLEREIGGRRYRIAAQAVWNAAKQQSYSRQVVLGPAEAEPMANLSATQEGGTRRVGDGGARVRGAGQRDGAKSR